MTSGRKGRGLELNQTGVQARVMCYNIRGERAPAGTLSDRHIEQFERIARWRPHFLAVQEGRFLRENYKRGLYLAEHITGLRAIPLASSHHDCDLITFLRPDIQILEERHERGHPYWHALNRVRVRIAGRDLDVLNYHAPPSAESLRAAEAETFALLVKKEEGGNELPLRIMAADFNCVPADHPETDRSDGKFNRVPAVEMARQGWVDAATVAGDATPTVGYMRAGQTQYRCDGIRSTLPADWLASYWVVRDMDHLSDHRPVGADYVIPVAGDGGA
jgi:hypothetical protein